MNLPKGERSGFGANPEIEDKEETITTATRLTPVTAPIIPIDPSETHLVQSAFTRTSGKGSYESSGIIYEGEDFDPENCTGPFPDEWYIDEGPYKIGGDTPRMNAGTGTVAVPKGTLVFHSSGSGSGYNSVTIERVGTGQTYSTPLPVGARPRDLFKYFPEGSYIAIPGEKGVVNKEYVPPMEIEFRLDSFARTQAPNLLLLDEEIETTEPGQYATGWVVPEMHSASTFVKEGSKRGRKVGTSILTIPPKTDLKTRYALIRDGLGDEWNVVTWKDIFPMKSKEPSILSWEDFTTIYSHEHGDIPPEIPAPEEIIPYPEKPFEGRGQKFMYLYRDPNGAVLATAARHYNPNSATLRNTTVNLQGSGVYDLELNIGDVIKPIDIGGANFGNSWYRVEPGSDVSAVTRVSLGNVEITSKRLKVPEVPHEPGLYAVWYDPDSGGNKEPVNCVLHPTSFDVNGKKVVAHLEFEITGFLERENELTRRASRLMSDEAHLERKNSFALKAKEVNQIAKDTGQTWIIMEEGVEISQDEPDLPAFEVPSPEELYKISFESSMMGVEYGALERGKFQKGKHPGTGEDVWYCTYTDFDGNEVKVLLDTESRIPKYQELDYFFEVIEPGRARLISPFPESDPSLDVTSLNSFENETETMENLRGTRLLELRDRTPEELMTYIAESRGDPGKQRHAVASLVERGVPGILSIAGLGLDQSEIDRMVTDTVKTLEKDLDQAIVASDKGVDTELPDLLPDMIRRMKNLPIVLKLTTSDLTREYLGDDPDSIELLVGKLLEELDGYSDEDLSSLDSDILLEVVLDELSQ